MCEITLFVFGLLSQMAGVVEDNYHKQLTIDGKPVNVEFLEAPAQTEFQGLREVYLRNSSVFLLCFAVNNRQSCLSHPHPFITVALCVVITVLLY